MTDARSTLVLGVDPGSRWIGWALLRVDAGYRLAGVLDLEELGGPGIVVRLATIASDAGCRRVGIECVEAVGYRPGFGTRMAGDLVRAARLGGRIAQAFEDRGAAVTEVTAEEVRTHFFNQRSVDAKAVRALVELKAPGWPKKLPGVLAKDAGHARDAAAVALYVGRAA